MPRATRLPPPPPFEPRIHLSPVALFRRLSEGRATLLFDVRPHPGDWTFEGAERWSTERWSRELISSGVPLADGDETLGVLFDEDGEGASALARSLGDPRVRALYGGLDLYRFALEPAAVGDRRFLRRPQS